MRSYATRAGRWPLAFTAAVATVAALSACADDPVGPRNPSPSKPNASALAGDAEVTVTNKSGGTEVGSLRWAAAKLDSLGGGTIHFDPKLGADTITLGAGLILYRNTVIDGPANGITLSGNDQYRVVEGGAVLALRNLTITKGYALDGGAGIYASSSFNMQHVTVQGNRGRSAVYLRYVWADISNSTISGNTVSNAAVEYKNGTTNLYHTTIAFNAPGAGLALYDPTSGAYTLVKLHNTIVSNNGSPQQNCRSYWEIAYEGRNISNDWSCGEVGITVADPKLFPLANNGGPNMTHAISHLGAAFNSGLDCWAGYEDQRYVLRDAKCDVGAFEFNDWTKVTITIDPSVKLDAAIGRAQLTGTIKCSRVDSFRLALELHQDQKVNGTVVDAHAASDVPIACTPSGGRWAATMVLTDGAWQVGSARATALTFQTPEWVTPASVASAVRIRK